MDDSENDSENSSLVQIDEQTNNPTEWWIRLTFNYVLGLSSINNKHCSPLAPNISQPWPDLTLYFYSPVDLIGLFV